MIKVLEEMNKHLEILSHFLWSRGMENTHPCMVETMKIVDLVEAMGIMKSPYTEVKWRSIDPMMEDRFIIIQSR
jgi:hypothetical protein